MRLGKGTGRQALPVVAMVTGVLFGLLVGLSARGASERIPGKELALLHEAWRTIQEHYVDRSALKPRRLAYGGIAGMVASLGDTGHSTFLSPELEKLEANLLAGRFEGIGAELRVKAGHPVIVAPLDGSPAQRAGIRPGDVILQVDGKDMNGCPLPDVVDHLKGRAGTAVALRLLTPSTGRLREVRLVRAAMTLQNVTWQQLPGTELAHLRIATFSLSATLAVERALGQITRRKLRGVILDLRDNPGGVLGEAVSAISQFVARGDALQVRDAQRQVLAVPVAGKGLGFGVPLVVLINRGSASAAEIMAGAIRDAHRAKLVGETSFGAGTVLQPFPLSDGSKLLLAVNEWLTPNGQAIWHRGITPDLAVDLPDDTSPLFPEMERNMDAATLRKSHDRQLLRAIALLESNAASR